MPDRLPARRKTHDVSQPLHRRARLLIGQLERDMAGVLRQLGQDAANAFLHHAPRRLPPTAGERAQLVDSTLQTMGVRGWLQRHLRPILRNHAARVINDTRRTLSAEIGLDLRVSADDARTIMGSAGKDLRLPDIEPQIRQAILRMLEDGFARGENPIATARRIREHVPAGRFVHAGPVYRAKLISRTETMNMQRAATLASYRSQPSVVAVRIRDGILSDSDDACRARDGREVAIAEASTVQPLHPQCTLSFSPVIAATLADLPEQPSLPEPELITV